MTLLSKEQILGADDLPYEDVEVKEWGGTVRIRALTGFERDRFELSVQADPKGKRNLDNVRARLVSLCLVDDEGKRMFTEAEVKDLGSKSARALDRLFDAARKLSGLGDEDIEVLAEGFTSGPAGGSSTG